MKKKKVILGALVATASVVGLAACTPKDNTTSGTGATDTTTNNTTTAVDTTTANTTTVDTTTVATTTANTTTADTTTVATTTANTTTADTTTTSDTTSVDTTTSDTTTSTTDAQEAGETSVEVKFHYNPDNYDLVGNIIDVELVKDAFGDLTSEFDIEQYKPTDSYRKFVGWYTDKELKNPFDASETLLEDVDLYAKWAGDSINVTYELDAAKASTGSLAADYKSGIYTVSAGTEVRSKKDNTGATHNSFKLGGTANKIKVEVPKDTTMTIDMADQSSTTDAYLILCSDADCTNIVVNDIGKDGDTASSNGKLVNVPVTAGTYYIARGAGTVDVFTISLACNVDLAPAESIEMVALGENWVIEGNDYDPSDVKFKLNYQNGSSEDIALNAKGVNINTSAVDVTTPGVYEVTVSYELEETIYNEKLVNTYTTKYNVEVEELTEIVANTNVYTTGKTSYGTGTYINKTAPQVYLVGDSINTTYLIITAVTNTSTGEKTHILATSAYTSDAETTFDSANAGVKTVTFTYTTNGKTETATYTSTVTAATPAYDEETNTINISVDASYSGEIAAQAAVGSITANKFNTINAAMDFLHLYMDATDSKYAGCNINFMIAAGYYNEKVEFDLPNMTVTGAGRANVAATTTAGADVAIANYDFKSTTTATVIEFDAEYDMKDAAGHVHTTDSTATVSVRETAENFKISGVSISNYINTIGKTYKNGEHRALAILVQADKFIMDDCDLYGYQDTLELYKGRQVIQNSLITGATDFIFGSNNTTYFANCEIRTVQSEDSSGKTTESGGYITAFKGCSSGAADAVEYGAIFDGCNFTCDAGVLKKGDTNKDGETATTGNTAIARPWGLYAKVAVINSHLGGHISTASAATKNADGKWGAAISQNARYVKMSSNEPTASTLKFAEFNNDGDGAVNETEAANIAGLTFLTSTEAAKYSDMKVIFATPNGSVTYDDSWLGTLVKDTTITVSTPDDTVLTTTLSYKNITLTEDEINEIIASIKVEDGQEVKGLYTDAAFETEWDGKVGASDLTIYAKIAAAAETVTYSYTYGGTNDAAWVETYNGSAASKDATPVTGGKVASGDETDNLTVTIDATKKIELAVTGFTTGSDKASKYLGIKFYNGSTLVSETTGTTPLSKCNGAMTLENDGVFEFDTEITKIVFYSNTANKTVGIVAVNVVAYKENDPNLIKATSTLTFGSSNTKADAIKFEGNSGQFVVNGVTLNIDATATSAKFDNTNNANYAQCNAGTVITFKVLAGAKITITTLNANVLTVALGSAEAVANATNPQEYTATEDCTVTITYTAADWVKTIAVQYN